ncbi:MAG: hypothetical protein M3410_16820 [Acidobacteriota bacterium]|nr:hypothetical protein [Acidobacteriota bacterium]
MSEENTQNMPGANGGSFEGRVLARFDTIDAGLRGLDGRMQKLEVRLRDLDGRMQKLEARSYDTKPIWEQALKEIIGTRRELSKRLDRIEAIAHDSRADLRDAEDRIEKLESKPIQ